MCHLLCSPLLKVGTVARKFHYAEGIKSSPCVLPHFSISTAHHYRNEAGLGCPKVPKLRGHSRSKKPKHIGRITIYLRIQNKVARELIISYSIITVCKSCRWTISVRADPCGRANTFERVGCIPRLAFDYTICANYPL